MPQLTDEQRRELLWLSQYAIGRVALRAQMVLLWDRGYSLLRIAEIHDGDQDMVRHWLRQYAEHGVAGLEDEVPRGEPPDNPSSQQGTGGQAPSSGAGPSEGQELLGHLSLPN